ncbi:MAG TPA: aldo/keto reductase [Kofleriaceae bacterium]|nr:aldo/keto reductase [Kofleriaceae bacterium]
MITRAISRAGRDVTIVGLGTRGLGGGLRGMEPEDVARVVPAAIEMGVTLVDVSPAWPDSLRVVGDAVRALRARDRVCVACAVPPLSARSSLAGAIAAATPSSALIIPVSKKKSAALMAARAQPIGYVQKTVEDALRALKVDALSLAWLGGWRDAWLDEKVWPELHGTLMRLMREGKVLAWGVAAPDDAPGDALRAVAEPWVAAVSARFSLFDRTANVADGGAGDGGALVPAAAKAGVAVIAREPLARGALGGELGPTVRFPPEDERRSWSEARLASIVPELARLAAFASHTPPAASSSVEGRSVLEQMKRGDDLTATTVADLALRYILDTAGITAATVGVRTIPHLAAALGAADGAALPARIRAELDDRRWGEHWYETRYEAGR